MKMTHWTLAVVASLLFAGAGPAAASVDSLMVATSAWQRVSAGASFHEGSVRLALVFEKSAPAAAVATGDEMETPVEGPRIAVEVTYTGTPGATGGKGVPSLEGVADAGEWVDEEAMTGSGSDLPADSAPARSRVLTARVGKAAYRLSGVPVVAEGVALLKALLTGDPVLYRARRHYPASVMLARLTPPMKLLEAAGPPDYFRMVRPSQLQDVEIEVQPSAPFVLHFVMRHDELVFRKGELAVTSAPDHAGIRVWAKSGKIALYADTDDAAVAEFDIGGERAAGEWRYQAGGTSYTAADAVIETGGRLIVRLAGKAPEKPAVAAPTSPEAAEVAESLASWIEAGERTAAVPPELACLLFSQPADRKTGTCWKAGPGWLKAARGTAKGPTVDTNGWLDGLNREACTKLVEEVAGSGRIESAHGWTAADARYALAAARSAEQEPVPAKIARARTALAAFFSLVVASPEPAGKRGSDEIVAGHAWAALGFLKAYDVLREPGYRRVALEQAEHLLREHINEADGSLVARKGDGVATKLETAGLVAQALYRGWRASSKPAYKKALDGVRARVLRSWAKAGGFALASSGKAAPKAVAPEAAEQYWALTAFSDRFYPYWDLPGNDWLK